MTPSSIKAVYALEYSQFSVLYNLQLIATQGFFECKLEYGLVLTTY
jgi:hypothetical protein